MLSIELKFGLGIMGGILAACVVSYPIAMFSFVHNLMSRDAASSQAILDYITRECESVSVKAHNLMYYSKGRNAPECWGAFTLFPEDFTAYTEKLKSQTDRYTTGGECGAFSPPRPPKVFPVPADTTDRFNPGPDPNGDWWLYKATNTTAYCTEDHHLWLCCDTDNHRVFFYRNRN